MTSFDELLTAVAADFPAIVFVESDDFAWMPNRSTIRYNATSPNATHHLLHELAHSALGHATHQRDGELLSMEREAWHYAAVTLAPRYGISLSMDDAVVQDALDTYRLWLHQRSCCPSCDAVGLQSSKQTYRCLLCARTWRVNDAKTCRLRRTLLP